MSYARSPRPSLLMTVGIMLLRLPPCIEPDWWLWPGRRICHRKVGAEVGPAAQRLERQRRGGKPELDGRILRPGSLLGVRTQQAGEVGVDVGGPGAERMGHGQQALGRNFLPAAFDLGKVGR